MHTHDIWSRFRDHFQALDHTLVPGTPLPVDDPTLLFVGAGMVPFKPYFTGELQPPFARAVSRQKCVRTTDIDAVGHSMRYNTFFQMAGSFAFADYFKTEAITYAWDLLNRSTGDGGLGVDPDRIWVTVFETDDEAVALWRRIAGLPADRIQRLGRADNLWNMGVPGPCGPSSEIFFDRGPQYGPDGGPAVDTDRFMEIWNLVFMQDERGPGSGDDYPILGPLPARNIDTGMGLERTAVVLQEVGTVYETDLLRPILDHISALSGRRYGRDRDDDVRLRIVADHTRSALMLVADGVTPSTDGRGYVLRRLIRRTVRSAKLLGIDEPVIGELLGVARDLLAPFYPELVDEFGRIDAIVRGEEDAFRRTLLAGSKVFELAASNSPSISGEQAFALHDTYGFPIDLTREMATERGLTVDEAGFRTRMEQQRVRARSNSTGRRADMSAFHGLSSTIFTGYDELSTTATISGLVRDGSPVQAINAASGSETVDVVLDRTPLYAESGGQASDAGRIVADGVEVELLDVRKVSGGVWTHRVRIESGVLAVGTPVEVHVDPDWRHGARQAHSGTHIVHAALRQVLGPTALQRGSANRPGYLRLDFAWPTALSPSELAKVEAVANRAVLDDLPVHVWHCTLAEAESQGAIALFGEAYGSSVRVVEIGGPWSRELCGGTHVTGSAQVGPIAIVGESSVGSGVRRIEAYVGLRAYEHLATVRTIVDSVSARLKTVPADLPQRVDDLLVRLRNAERQLQRFGLSQRATQAQEAVASAEHIGDIDLVTHSVAGETSMASLRRFADDIVGHLGERPGVVALVGPSDGRTTCVLATTATARDCGFSAHALIQPFVAALGGRGGGTATVAQGSGSDATGIDDAFERLRKAVG